MSTMYVTPKTLLLILTGIVLAGFGLWWAFFHDRYEVRHTPLIKAGPILFFGDSLVAGVGANVGHDLPALLTKELGEPVLNYGMAGDTTRQGLMRMKNAAAEHPRLVLILLGGNDFLQKVPRDETFANLKSIIALFQSDGAAVIVIGVRSGLVGGGADDRYEALAKETESAYIEDVLKGVFGNPALMSDTIHPNDRGYEKIATRILETIKPILQAR